jgi:hypothetical protein
MREMFVQKDGSSLVTTADVHGLPGVANRDQFD